VRSRRLTLLEATTLLAAGALVTREESSSGRTLPVMQQARIMLEVMRKATRIGQVVAMWTIAKYDDGATTAERVAAYWDLAADRLPVAGRVPCSVVAGGT
jgi:hypothetical protein